MIHADEIAARAVPATIGDVLDASNATGEAVGIVLAMILEPAQRAAIITKLAKVWDSGTLSDSDGTYTAAIGLARGLKSPHGRK